MKMSLALLFSALCLLSGCARHYYKITENGVHIYLKKKSAGIVQIAYSLDGYQPHRAKRAKGETWVSWVPENTEFSYFYIVDGTMYLPSCKSREQDDFGSENCLYVPEK
jgi:hypothetical protein